MNIYVGNLPRNTSVDSIREAFAQHGEVADVKLIKDQYSGELRGFGFVEMPSKEEAKKAIEEINGSEIGGRRLIVNEAKPRAERSNNNRRSW